MSDFTPKQLNYAALKLQAKKKAEENGQSVASAISQHSEPVSEHIDKMPEPVVETMPEEIPAFDVVEPEPEPDEVKLSNTPFGAPKSVPQDDLDDFMAEFDEQTDDVIDVPPVAEDMPVSQPVHEYETPGQLKTDTRPASRPQKPSAPPKSTASKTETAILRKVPKSVVQRTRYLFPDATNQDEAVAAYIYHHEGCPADLDVPDRIKEVAKSYIGEVVTNEDLQGNVSAEIVKLRTDNRLLMQKLEAVEMAVVYTIFDRLGFRKGNTTSIKDLKFDEKGMRELFDNLETTSINYQQAVKHQDSLRKR